jgi:hypothetical protein
LILTFFGERRAAVANLMAVLGRLKRGRVEAGCVEDVICSSDAGQTFREG